MEFIIFLIAEVVILSSLVFSLYKFVKNLKLSQPKKPMFAYIYLIWSFTFLFFGMIVFFLLSVANVVLVLYKINQWNDKFKEGTFPCVICGERNEYSLFPKENIKVMQCFNCGAEYEIER